MAPDAALDAGQQEPPPPEAAPPTFQEVPADAPRQGPVAILATALLALDLAFLAYTLALGVLALAFRSGAASPALTPRSVAAETAFLFVLFAVVPVLWLLGTRARPVEGTVRYLRLFDAGPSILRGVGVGVLCLAGLVAASLLLQRLGWMEENPVGDELLKTLDWPLAVFVSLAAGVGEEIFFRGILQRWVGLWGQALLFAVAHAGYGTLMQIVVPGLLGLLFGTLVRRGSSLWLVIAAHFTFNFLQMALSLAVGQ